jgi:hypothetical protein
MCADHGERNKDDRQPSGGDGFLNTTTRENAGVSGQHGA